MKEYANKKPSVSSTTWTRIFHNNGVEVYEADKYFDFYRVNSGSDRPKYFFGETAWMNCQRYVVDKIGMVGYTVFD